MNMTTQQMAERRKSQIREIGFAKRATVIREVTAPFISPAGYDVASSRASCSGALILEDAILKARIGPIDANSSAEAFGLLRFMRPMEPCHIRAGTSGEKNSDSHGDDIIFHDTPNTPVNQYQQNSRTRKTTAYAASIRILATVCMSQLSRNMVFPAIALPASY